MGPEGPVVSDSNMVNGEEEDVPQVHDYGTSLPRPEPCATTPTEPPRVHPHTHSSTSDQVYPTSTISRTGPSTTTDSSATCVSMGASRTTTPVDARHSSSTRSRRGTFWYGKCRV